MDQVKTIYKISQILSQAFKEVNDVCAHYLADQSLENGNQKHAEKKSPQEKPKQKTVPAQEPQQKKEQKADQKKQTKITVPEKQISKSVQQPKKQTQPKQAQQKDQKGSNPEKPKQPISAFFLFVQEQKQNVKKVHPNSSVTDISKMMGEIWRGLQQNEKAPYVTKAEELKKNYLKDLKHFYEKHPEFKSKRQLKKEKAQQKNHEQVKEASVPSAPAKQSRKPIVIEEENSESV